jgi:penicillin-binding protein 1C
MQLSKIGSRIRLSKKVWRRGAIALLALILALYALCWAVPLPERLLASSSPVLRYRDATPAYVFLSPDDKWRIALAADAIDPRYVEALIRLEDKRFWWHPGVDPVALSRAMAKNVLRRRVVTGGSTITMQLVRVLEPRPRRMLSKLIEALRAVQLEVRLGKRGVLAAYMTYAPFGRNIEGVEAAAWSYFGHGAGALTAAEISTLLAVPQAPARRFPQALHTERLRDARNEIARRLAGWGLLPRGSKNVEAQPVPNRLKLFPRHAPHAAFWLKDASTPSEGVTTLDAGIQSQVERLAGVASLHARNQGVRGHAVVVVDNETAEVRALVGGAAFWDAELGSQIPAFAVPRSPGSALKPLIYALAIDRGLVLPEFLVEDAPKDFGGYTPKNYDGGYSGLITLERALAQSLNIPFVTLLGELGIERFLGLLAQAGAPRLGLVPGHHGLSAAVGGMAMTALEIASQYVALARDGGWRPLVFIPPPPGTKPAEAMSLMSPGAAHLTRRALRIRDRPDFPRRRDVTRLPPTIFWKTGTSFGHRDAWAVGGTARYTVAVWFGNLDYSPTFALTGSDMAAPLLFDVLEGLASPLDRLIRDDPPKDLTSVEVCAYSGRLPSGACPLKRTVLAPQAHVPTAVCPFHVKLAIAARSGLALTPSCKERYASSPGAVIERLFLRWPSGVKRYLGAAHRRMPEPPAFAPGCEPSDTVGNARLTIASPRQGHVVLLIPGMDPSRQEVPFEAESSSLTTALSWFVDGEFLGSLAPTARYWWTPKPGVHEVSVADGFGLIARRRVEVRVR